jgi:hypothetical protein
MQQQAVAIMHAAASSGKQECSSKQERSGKHVGSRMQYQA